MTVSEYNKTCEHIETAESYGFIVCRDCGMTLSRILTQTMTLTTESKDFNFDTKQYTEVMTPFNPGTNIDRNIYTLRDHNKKQVDSKWFYLKKIHFHMTKTSLMRSHERTLMLLQKICNHFHLPFQTKNLAIYYYRKIRKEEQQISEKRINGSKVMICSALYVIRSQHPQIERKAIVELLRELGYDRYVNNLNKLYRGYYHYFPKTEPIKPEIYLEQLIDKILADPNFKIKINRRLFIKTSYAILKTLSSLKCSGKTPIVLAATSLYLINNIILDLKLTQKLVAKVANITSASIRNTIPLFNLKKIKTLGDKYFD